MILFDALEVTDIHAYSIVTPFHTASEINYEYSLPIAVLAQAMLHLRFLQPTPRLLHRQRRPRRTDLLQGLLRPKVWRQGGRVRDGRWGTQHGEKRGCEDTFF